VAGYFWRPVARIGLQVAGFTEGRCSGGLTPEDDWRRALQANTPEPSVPPGIRRLTGAGGAHGRPRGHAAPTARAPSTMHHRPSHRSTWPIVRAAPLSFAAAGSLRIGDAIGDGTLFEARALHPPRGRTLSAASTMPRPVTVFSNATVREDV
jgi:hypothetical protein